MHRLYVCDVLKDTGTDGLASWHKREMYYYITSRAKNHLKNNITLP